jgi:hypothetical protein
MKRKDTWLSRLVIYVAVIGFAWMVVSLFADCQMNSYGCY